MPLVGREVCRKRLLNRLASAERKGDQAQSAMLRAQLAHYPIGGIHPDVVASMLAHCGQWHIMETIPFVVPCCGTSFFGALMQ